jgi:membrane protein required for colicin V production
VHWIDWVALGIIALSTLASLWRGFVREALSLVAWVAAFVIATVMSDRMAGLLGEFVGNETARYVAAWILLFIGILVLGALVNSLMAQLIRATGLSGLDRILGMVFGFARGLVVVLALLYVARELLPPQEQQIFQDSRLLPHLDMVATWARDTFSSLQPR